MKLRQDFVSNSSSTSYVFVADNKKDCLDYADEVKCMLGDWIESRLCSMEACFEHEDQKVVRTTCKIVTDEEFVENWWKPRDCNDDYCLFDGPQLYIVPNSLLLLLSIINADVCNDCNDLVVTPQFVACKDMIKNFLVKMLQEKYEGWHIAYSNTDNNDYENYDRAYFPPKTIWQTSFPS